MPIHDWTRVPAGLFHDFHQTWTIYLKTALNRGILPKQFQAIVEQDANDADSDLPEKQHYARRANRIAIKHQLRRTVAIVEIVSPGNKASRQAILEFVGRVNDYLQRGVHVLIVDLFPPSLWDPCGIHKKIWDTFREEQYSLPNGADRILASYEAATEIVAYVDPIALGCALPAMPLFIDKGQYVSVPLEPTYQSTWEACPGQHAFNRPIFQDE